ncbi:TPA: hypothetical protein DEP30_02450 [Candidatus Nomurabacteria bacterium]|nr:MAG: hypothetical protein UR97_C0003G0002 [Candidatus Nomurabacteria bacterium GW2011_GWE2_36_115]KKP94130.1 MAG: hypothetical protein US00_C0003G0054 [Candidatus Nomurabacteria bacterium GW2011_GWF2_36_126]KKP96742.1 MAG: hypothetical protein US04_C0001G0244 [Candidatus Nomurabacteria bacterium GW2011_GWD2_36_14]KKP99654.1 MAG: hypothetical protein US08_C0001G0337 [Candidatus Nomurabacteria bacterium GW2011_GWF2_36_19]KKQ05430.1 MAG: hypothetical protein US17_C0004G0002 [Candidatus Nomuraba
MISIFPIAEASVTTLMNSINRVIIGPLIMFLFALAVIYFMYGLFQYLISPDNEEIKKTSKKHMFWGIFGMFIMVAVFGILNLILNTLGESRIHINNGQYTIDKINPNKPQ